MHPNPSQLPVTLHLPLTLKVLTHNTHTRKGNPGFMTLLVMWAMDIIIDPDCYMTIDLDKVLRSSLSPDVTVALIGITPATWWSPGPTPPQVWVLPLASTLPQW